MHKLNLDYSTYDEYVPCINIQRNHSRFSRTNYHYQLLNNLKKRGGIADRKIPRDIFPLNDAS